MPTSAADYEIEIFRIRSQSIEKYTYYILAGNASAIAFSISQTHDTPLTAITIPLVLALFFWAYGFYAGCRSLLYSHLTMYNNLGLLRIQQGKDPLSGNDQEKIAIGVEVVSEFANKHGDIAGRYSNRQFSALGIGAILFIVWHLLRMALLNPQIVLWIQKVLP